MDPLMEAFLTSAVGKATEVLAGRLLDKPWARDFDAGMALIEQLKENAAKENYVRLQVLPSLKMRTLHRADYDVLLDSIYYPLTLTTAKNHDSIIVKDGETISFDGVVNIIGIAGQGKSTILRKLFSEELKLGERIPFFIELRRVDDGDVLNYLKSCIRDIGLGVTDDNVEMLLQSKKVVLMLDGFDEVKHDLRIIVLNSIRNIRNSYNTRVIVTSRPNTEICTEINIHNLYIEDLNLVDKIRVLNILSFNDHDANNNDTFIILAGLLCENEDLEGTICNPILITLLYHCYPHLDVIPNNVVEFYRSLFMTLYARHDKIKNHARERKSIIDGEAARWCFSAICFSSLMEEDYELFGESLFRYVEDAIETEGYDRTQTQPFIDDIINITCLIQPDGDNRFVFLHKSVQEFHAAFAVANLSTDDKLSVYEDLVEQVKSSEQIDNMMVYLSALDKKAYSEFVTLKAFNELGFVDIANASDETIDDTFLSALDGLDVHGRQKVGGHEVVLSHSISLGEVLNLNILPVLAGYPREIMSVIDHAFETEFSFVIDKSDLETDVSYRTVNINSSAFDIEKSDSEYYLIDFVSLLKKQKLYEPLKMDYITAIKKYYQDVYKPNHAKNAMRNKAIKKNFKIKRR